MVASFSPRIFSALSTQSVSLCLFALFFLLSVSTTTLALYDPASLLTSSATSFTTTQPKFEERLLLRPFPDGKVLLHFTFEMEHKHEPVARFFTHFPKSLGQVLHRFDVEELHLSLTSGRWDTNVWGYPSSSASPFTPEQEVHPAPKGAELWAVFPKSGVSNHSAVPEEEQEDEEETISEQEAVEAIQRKLQAEDSDILSALFTSFLQDNSSSTPSTSSSSPASARSSFRVRPSASDVYRWNGLQQALSGLFCTSLAQMASSQSSFPQNSFFPANAKEFLQKNSTLFYGTLPRENLCTENLTPFLSLLPASASSGLAFALLRPDQLSKLYMKSGLYGDYGNTALRGDEYIKTAPGVRAFDSFYQSLQIHVYPIIEDGQRVGWKLVQAFDVVLDTLSLKGPDVAPSASFTLSQLLNGGLSPAVFATKSKVTMELGSWIKSMAPETWNYYLSGKGTQGQSEEEGEEEDERELIIAPAPQESWTSDGKDILYLTWDLREALILAAIYADPILNPPVQINTHGVDIGETPQDKLRKELEEAEKAIRAPIPWPDQSQGFPLSITWGADDYMVHTFSQYPRLSPRSLVYVSRFLSSDRGGQKEGRLNIILNNFHPSVPIIVRYFDHMPWYVKLYLHTMRISVDGKDITKEVLLAHRLVPSQVHGAPAEIELQLRLKPNTATSITIDFEKSFLNINDFPPDVSRGFDLPCGMIIVEALENADSSSFRPFTFYSESPLLLSLPFPDFSMPFNVIAFSSTIIAFFFGSMFNTLYSSDEEILTRGFKEEKLPVPKKNKDESKESQNKTVEAASNEMLHATSLISD